MTDYVHLVGTEQMQIAANSMRDAAQSFRETFGYLQDTLAYERTQMYEWLARFEAAVDKLKEVKP
jgi:hypothetical protein